MGSSGFLLWQTLWLYFIASVYVFIPSISVFVCTKTICPCCFTYFKRRDAMNDARHDLMVRDMLLNHNLNAEFMNEVHDDEESDSSLSAKSLNVNGCNDPAMNEEEE